MTGAPIGDTLRQIGRLFAGGTVAGQSDAALLRRFVAERDEEAFAGLVARHGPMVLAVCRGALRDPADAEDAFQATFLVLVRRAGSIWVDESLGGWLYRVARRVARRANAEAMKREARQRRGAEMDAFAGRDVGEQDRPEAALHEEIARLPEAMRRAVVLCELEGITQAEAACVLHCGEATLRRRLAGARERLRTRLVGQGVTPSALALLRPAVVPTGWAEATVRAAMASGRIATRAARLAAAVAGSMILARRLRVAALAVVGLASAWGVVAAQQGKDDVARPAAIPKADRPAPAPTWAHLTTDVGPESWVRLEDGRMLWKGSNGDSGVHDPASGTTLYAIGDSIARNTNVGMKDGRPEAGSVLDHRAEVRPLDERDMRPGKATEEERRSGRGKSYFDAEVVDLDGLRCLRRDRYSPDALGRVRLDEQTWYDLETRRPVRRRTLIPPTSQEHYKREYRTTIIAYADGGPADLYALGVPPGARIVDRGTPDRGAIAPKLQKVFDAAARAIERLPRSCRIVEYDDHGRRLACTYWSAPAGYLEAWAAFVRDHNDRGINGTGQPRSFSADHQPFRDIEIPQALRTSHESDLPADGLAAWLPTHWSLNAHLRDGERSYYRTWHSARPDGSRTVQVEVRKYDPPYYLPDPYKEIWAFAFDNRRNLKLVTPEPGTPPAWVAIELDRGQSRALYYADPAHDYAVARTVQWSGHDGGKMKFRTESKALRWKQLPGGTWYVSAWERRQHLDRVDASGKAAPAQPDSTWFRRVEITPMDPDRFPPGIFDGEALLESARKEGAKIEVD